MSYCRFTLCGWVAAAWTHSRNPPLSYMTEVLCHSLLFPWNEPLKQDQLSLSHPDKGSTQLAEWECLSDCWKHPAWIKLDDGDEFLRRLFRPLLVLLHGVGSFDYVKVSFIKILPSGLLQGSSSFFIPIVLMLNTSWICFTSKEVLYWVNVWS